ncbi:GLPGLI family protein [Winogradskyella sediminis]|uniref:GLPGLI family protein n=2 Tax=Winogradskyella sediminis TaxID=1382466 RepID=A0A1H1R401_9FLAO|nr:GLPGLI family protein [Winogradskyella sediminis]
MHGMIFRKNKVTNKFKLLFVLSLISSLAYCQRTSVVGYNVAIKQKKTTDSINKDFQNKKEKMIRSIEQSNYELIFNDSLSVFQVNEEMQLDDVKNIKVASSLVGGKNYKNLKDSINIKQKEFFGELFNIYNPFNEYNWNITKETKDISGYKCYRAVTEIVQSSFIRKKDVKYLVEAWFTPEIPAPFGPAGIDGLPGLVLEGSSNNGSAIFYVTTLNLINNDKSVSDNIDLSKGKNISKKDYDIMIREKYLSLRNQN